MVSTTAVIIFVGVLVVIGNFVLWCIRRKRLHLLHRLYLALVICYASWVVPLIVMHFVNSDNQSLMFVLDCCTSPGGLFSSAIYLCIAVAFVGGWEKMPSKLWLVFLVPAMGVLVTFTNPLHHLQYVVFSTVKENIVFGPFVIVTGVYSYICLLSGMIIMIRFAWRNKSKLYKVQGSLFALGGFAPLLMSLYCTFLDTRMPITATPLSFLVPLLTHGIAIYQMHFLDIRPIATQHVMDWISDCYLVLSNDGLVITYNRQFASIFASKYGISENRYLKDCVKEEDISKKTAVFNMITAVQSCKDSLAAVTYEQAMTVMTDDKAQKLYYIAEVSPLIVNEKLEGFVVIYKEVTSLRESMRQLQESQERMMEQERLAFLGQMIGGLAHNLKTPIMSISGCISAQDALIDECESSLGDTEVTPEDFAEIFKEARSWGLQMRESLAYMSDIITAIKGQAANAVTDDNSIFTIEEALSRCKLLMRHELLAGQCTLIIHEREGYTYSLSGDINNLVQVLDNLLSNAIYAQQQNGGGEIHIQIAEKKETLDLSVVDTGPGVSANVREKLFKAMVTNKGSKGTGLGLYISSAIIRGKFEGSMWMEDNPGGGSIFGISIPMERVSITKIKQEGADLGEKE